MPSIKTALILITYTVFITFLCTVVVYFATQTVGHHKLGVPITMVEPCEGFPLKDTADCLNDLIEPHFKWVDTPDSKKMNVSELFEQGGDCNNWAQWYYESALLLNKSAAQFTIPIRSGEGHRFTIMYDETGYCVMDNAFSKCGLYANYTGGIKWQMS